MCHSTTQLSQLPLPRLLKCCCSQVFSCKQCYSKYSDLYLYLFICFIADAGLQSRWWWSSWRGISSRDIGICVDPEVTDHSDWCDFISANSLRLLMKTLTGRFSPHYVATMYWPNVCTLFRFESQLELRNSVRRFQPSTNAEHGSWKISSTALLQLGMLTDRLVHSCLGC